MDLLNVQYAILATMLREPACVGEVMTRLTAQDFDSAATRGLFESIERLHAAGAPVDPVTVLREAGEAYLPAIEEIAKYTAGDAEYYCGMLREGIQLQRIQSCAVQLSTVSDLEQARKLIDRINGMITIRKKLEVTTAHDAASDFIRRMSRKRKPKYMSLGVPELDEKLFIEPGDFILIGGYASAGKTLLSLQFVLELTKKYRVGYFSLETNPKKLTDRLIAHMARVPLSVIKACCLDEGNARRATEAARVLDKLPLDLISAGGMAVRDIQALTLNKRYQVIFVDYLQIVSDPGKTRYEQATNISIALHTMAQSHGVTVFALAQLSRPEKNNRGELLPPNMSSFRESGQMEQDADVALLLWPEDPTDNRSDRILKVAKNKDGDRGSLKFSFDGAVQILTPVLDKGKAVAAYYSDVGRKARSRKSQEQTGFQDLDDDSDPPPF